MKQLSQIYSEKLDAMLPLIESRSFRECGRIATTIINSAVLAEDKDGVFVFEVLETSFNQMGITIEHFTVREEEIVNLISSLKEQIPKVWPSFNKDDKRELYELLREIRYTATAFQSVGMIKAPNPRHSEALEALEEAAE